MRRSELVSPGEAPNPLIFAARTRWAVSASAVTLGLLTVVLAGPGSEGPERSDRFVVVSSLGTVAQLLIATACTSRALRAGPPEYRVIWRQGLVALNLGLLAAALALASAPTQSPWLLLVNMVLLLVSVPLWFSIALHLARLHAGRRGISVDLVDTATALVVLGAPGALLLAQPMIDTERPAFVVPFALALVFAPATAYLLVANLTRIARGERAAHGLGAAVGIAAALNLSLHLARELGGLVLPLRLFILAQVLNMGLFVGPPLWAHRRCVGGLARLPAHRQLRRANPMPYVSAVVLPLLGAYVYLERDDRPWGVWFFAAVLLVAVLLNAVRYTATSRETSRLYAGIAHLAEERRHLLTQMLRMSDHDRHRTATELHSQAVGAIAALGAVVQLTHAALPGPAATTVKETLTPLQARLGVQAEHLRQLMMAIRSSSPDPPAAHAAAVATAEGLATALLAWASELEQDDAAPSIRVEVDPAVQLDWASMAIVYRIALEAVMNAATHAGAARIEVAVHQDDGQIVVEVQDDGIGFDPAGVAPARGLATMELFTQLGGGELTLRSTPGAGTVVRSRLGSRR